jgi:Leucine-rich repeat (LRR) protein
VPKLTKLNCSDNKLTELDISNAPELADLDCSGNQIAELDVVRRNRKLKVLKCDPSVSIKKLASQVLQNENKRWGQSCA